MGTCSILSAASYPVVNKPQKPYPKPIKHGHYGPPPCLPSEEAMYVGGINGTLCTTDCTDGGKCPSLGPESGIIPQCALEDPKTKKKYCAIVQCEYDCDCPLQESCVQSSMLPFSICIKVAPSKSAQGGVGGALAAPA